MNSQDCGYCTRKFRSSFHEWEDDVVVDGAGVCVPRLQKDYRIPKYSQLRGQKNPAQAFCYTCTVWKIGILTRQPTAIRLLHVIETITFNYNSPFMMKSQLVVLIVNSYFLMNEIVAIPFFTNNPDELFLWSLRRKQCDTTFCPWTRLLMTRNFTWKEGYSSSNITHLTC